MGSDVGELVHDGASTDYCPVVNVSLSGYAYIADEYAMVADVAVMGNVYIGHYQGVVSDAGNALAAGLGATVDSGALAYGDIVSYLYIGNLSLELEVLRLGTYYCTGEHTAT